MNWRFTNQKFNSVAFLCNSTKLKEITIDFQYGFMSCAQLAELGKKIQFLPFQGNFKFTYPSLWGFNLEYKLLKGVYRLVRNEKFFFFQ